MKERNQSSSLADKAGWNRVLIASSFEESNLSLKKIH